MLYDEVKGNKDNDIPFFNCYDVYGDVTLWGDEDSNGGFIYVVVICILIMFLLLLYWLITFLFSYCYYCFNSGKYICFYYYIYILNLLKYHVFCRMFLFMLWLVFIMVCYY